MKFTEILEMFRALGGTADNIQLHQGQFGRGIFPIDPRLMVKIIIPTHLLVSPSTLFLDRENHIRINKSLGLNPALIAFYEAYQQFYGWSVGGLDELSEYHDELNNLPRKLKQYLLLFGWLKSDFDKKSIKNHLNNYFECRQIRIENKVMLMPIIELTNHSANGKQYLADQGVSVEGTFKTEVLTCYSGNFDAFHFYRNYRFASESASVLSCDVKISVPEVGTINISRFGATIDINDGIVIPNIIKNKSEIRISFLELVSNYKSICPRRKFIDKMGRFGITTLTSNAIFNGLIEHNRQALADLISECTVSHNRIAKELEFIAENQLKLLK
jgi:hypothetical protein